MDQARTHGPKKKRAKRTREQENRVGQKSCNPELSSLTIYRRTNAFSFHRRHSIRFSVKTCHLLPSAAICCHALGQDCVRAVSGQECTSGVPKLKGYKMHTGMTIGVSIE